MSNTFNQTAIVSPLLVNRLFDMLFNNNPNVGQSCELLCHKVTDGIYR